MIILKSETNVFHKGKDIELNQPIFAMGELIGTDKHNLFFKERYYYELEEQIINPGYGDSVSEPEFIKNTKVMVDKNYSLDRNFFPLKKIHTGDELNAKQIQENLGTVDGLFEVIGFDITPLTGWSDGNQINFEQMFKTLLTQKQYFGVTKWNIVAQL